MGYLPLALSQAKLYFKGYLNPSAKGQDESGGAEREPWLDYKGTPVKWHIPTGTLYDLMCRYVYSGKSAHNHPLRPHLQAYLCTAQFIFSFSTEYE